MAHNKCSAEHWLVCDAYRAKAVIKYEIKRLESLLKHELADGKEPGCVTNPPVLVCRKISQRYGDYLQIVTAVESCASSKEDAAIARGSWQACYEHIQLLKQLLIKAVSIDDEIQQIGALQNLYQQLASILAKTVINKPVKPIEVDLSLTIQPLVQAESPADWLHAIVAFANQSGAHITDQLSQVAKLDQHQLQQLAKAFNQDDFTQIMSAIFFYKLYPDKLFDDASNPEKLVSVKTRLTVLYDFVEMLHQTITQALNQQGLTEVRDYLFHSEELPHGIEIDIGDDWRELMQSVVKSWRISPMPVNASDPGMNDIYDLFRAYKYWFNPNRLIDAAMILQERFGKFDNNLAADGVFYQQMVTRYHQLATTECLDLYGYFANKDSCYLMRTLLVIKNGTALTWLPSLTQSEQQAVVHVYETLECIMNALRGELAARHITTTSYSRDLSSIEITPGRRNRNAILRIISLYCNEGGGKNTRIEQLFDAVEAE